MPNRWVEFVKDCAARNNLSYGCAVTNADCKAEYAAIKASLPAKVKKSRRKVKGEDFGVTMEQVEQIPVRQSLPMAMPYQPVQYEDLEEAIPSQYPLIKNISMNPVKLLSNIYEFKEPRMERERPVLKMIKINDKKYIVRKDEKENPNKNIIDVFDYKKVTEEDVLKKVGKYNKNEKKLEVEIGVSKLKFLEGVRVPDWFKNRIIPDFYMLPNQKKYPEFMAEMGKLTGKDNLSTFDIIEAVKEAYKLLKVPDDKLQYIIGRDIDKYYLTNIDLIKKSWGHTETGNLIRFFAYLASEEAKEKNIKRNKDKWQEERMRVLEKIFNEGGLGKLIESTNLRMKRFPPDSSYFPIKEYLTQ